MAAKRFNKGKIRYELIPHGPLKHLAEVYTRGAHKYTVYKTPDGKLITGASIPFEDVHKMSLEVVEAGDHNWREGQDWMGVMASVKRHIAEWEAGIDKDPELGTYVLGNAVWGLMSILEFYKTHPELDNRHHRYLSMPKIGLDIDEVLADFVGGMLERFPDMNGKRSEYWNDPHIMDNFSKIANDESFWLGLKPKTNSIPFEPHCYITSRPVPSSVTEEWLKKNNFPRAPIFSLSGGHDKVEAAKSSGLDIFVDDRYENFVQLNRAGICTYLFDAPHNQRYYVGYRRIKSLNELL